MPRVRQTAPVTGPGRRYRNAPLFAAIGLTLLVRLWFVLGMRGHPFSTIWPQMIDSYYYHRWAIEVISGNFWGSDVFFLRPLYPYLLALVYAVFGIHVLPVQLLQTLLSAASCLLLYDTTRRLLGRRPAVFASFGFALSGILVFYTGTLLYVEITILLSLLFVWLILIAGRGVWLWVAAGVTFGLLVVCRPELLLLLPFLLLWLWKRPIVPGPKSQVHSPSSRGPGPSFLVTRRGLLALTVAALVVIAVVPVRNYIVARDPVLFTAHSGINFYYGNNPAADGTWQPTPELERGPGFSHDRLKRVSRTIAGRELSWSAASAYWTRRGIDFITHEPGRYLQLLGRKFLLFFSNYEVPNDYYPETARESSLPLRLAFVDFGLALGLGLLGMVWAWPKRTRALPAYLFVAAYFVSAVLFYVLSRLRAPVIPFLLMFAGFGLSALVDSLRQRRLVHATAGIAIALVVYVVSVLIPVRRQGYSALAWIQAGYIYLNQHDNNRGIEAFRRALSDQPRHYRARYGLIVALASSNRTKEAEVELEQMTQTTPLSSEVSYYFRLASARLAFARRDFAQAAVLYRSAVAENPYDATLAYTLAAAYFCMDSLVQAREQLVRAITLDPTNDAAREALKVVDSRLSR